jgi:hypothetical protein
MPKILNTQLFKATDATSEHGARMITDKASDNANELLKKKSLKISYNRVRYYNRINGDCEWCGGTGDSCNPNPFEGELEST